MFRCITQRALLLPRGFRINHPEQIRPNGSMVIRRNVVNPKTGELEFQDWDHLADAAETPSLVSGYSLRERHLDNKFHTKPWLFRKLRNMRVKYDRKQQLVTQLMGYIAYEKASNIIAEGEKDLYSFHRDKDKDDVKKKRGKNKGTELW
jgi:hypothetical protein